MQVFNRIKLKMKKIILTINTIQLYKIIKIYKMIMNILKINLPKRLAIKNKKMNN